MTLNEKLIEIFEEIDRIHPEGFFDGKAWSVADNFPNFTVARNGHERYFTKKAISALVIISTIIYENDNSISRVMEFEEFYKIVRQCVADLHVEDGLDLNSPDGVNNAHKKLLDYVKEKLSKTQMEFTHYFPAWTLGMESEQPFILGPVMIMTREQWIDSVEFDQELIDRYLNMPDENSKWKDTLRNALKNKKDDKNIKGLAMPVFSAIHEYPAILKITVKGYEHNLSRKVAEIVCKSALDAISLLFGSREYFHQQALGDERLQPIESSSMLEMDGHLLLPGYNLGPRFRHLSYHHVHNHLTANTAHLEVIGKIIQAIIDPSTSRHPDLSKRWLTALDWMAEGNREKNDSVALTKIATSLDVLACGVKNMGILEMLVHLTGIPKDEIIVNGRHPKKLRDVVKDIYDNGRSQILHGTHVDKLKSFEAWKSYASTLSRIALIESAVRLNKFTGKDEDKGFRTITG